MKPTHSKNREKDCPNCGRPLTECPICGNKTYCEYCNRCKLGCKKPIGLNLVNAVMVIRENGSYQDFLNALKG